MLYVDYEKKLGKITWLYNGEEFEVYIDKANCLGALIYEYQEDGRNMVQLQGFWNDVQHLKNCLGLTKDFKQDGNIYKDLFKRVTLYDTTKECDQIYKELIKANWNEGTIIEQIKRVEF